MQKIVKKTEKITPFSSRFIDRILPGKLHSPTLSALVDDDGSAPVVGTGVANRDGGFVLIVHMAADGFVERIKPWAVS